MAATTGLTSLLFEQFSFVAPLGLRFWDPIAGSLVNSDLQVVATSPANPANPVTATVNSRGVYGFVHLPGLRQLESGSGDQDYWSHLPAAAKRDFLITVTDSTGRFQPLKLTVTAPIKGLFALTCAGSTIAADWPASTVPLFSASTRPTPAGMAVIRSEVQTAAKTPAAWAIVEALWENNVIGRGLTDARGRLALLFPYPRPALNTLVALVKQRWDIQLRMYHAPILGAATLPDLCTVLQQPLLTPALAPIPTTPVTITFGQESVLK